MGACLVPLAAALALAGCASSPSRRSGVAMQAPVNGSSGCFAPAPNLRAAYNRDYTVLGRSYAPLRNASGYDVDGTASWYGWESGKTTSMGSSFNPRAFTAASRVLPLPTCVEVTNLRNGRSALVLVNDRGPFVDSRVMDLSYGAAKALGVTATGTAPVRIVALAPGALQAGPADVAAPPMPAPAQAQPLLGPQGAPETFAPAPLSPA
ncbi:MAG: septal ring lytic transglycosylase RlpA family protein, partial [Betaproteobacteria bacterium]|nr:septal ring lytic transglycosylase RlpA family protein [Betaproteobacteria bacterium]